MSITGVKMQLFCDSIADGLRFIVTDEQEQIIGSSYTTFGGPNKFRYELKKNGSYVADPKHSNGLIMSSTHSSTEAFSKNEIMHSVARFRIEGEVDGKAIEKKGYFKFTTTEWGRLARPDYGILLFSIDGMEASTVQIQMPTLVTPDPFRFTVAVKDGRVALIATTEATLETAILSNIMDGILKIHTKALSWVFGI